MTRRQDQAVTFYVLVVCLVVHTIQPIVSLHYRPFQVIAGHPLRRRAAGREVEAGIVNSGPESGGRRRIDKEVGGEDLLAVLGSCGADSGEENLAIGSNLEEGDDGHDFLIQRAQLLQLFRSICQSPDFVGEKYGGVNVTVDPEGFILDGPLQARRPHREELSQVKTREKTFLYEL